MESTKAALNPERLVTPYLGALHVALNDCGYTVCSALQAAIWNTAIMR